ncbi:hypothetical protein [Schlesneria paludicola]|uniref:hypothetical protein n=1 Tax=Schlesneria paludicola TaxID=360056 RepID=UPI0002FDF7DF|nr:hypothetical protein [Schlesneria paludicola]
MLDARQWFLGICGLTWLLAFVGCGSGTSSTNSSIDRPYRGQQVHLIVPDLLNLPAHWEVLIPEWSSQSGATAQFDKYDATADLSGQSLPSADTGGNVLLFPLRQLCDIDAKINPLNANEFAADARDIFKGLRERVLSRERQLVATPISAPVLACYYRADLLKAAKRKPPETWEDYEQLVSSLQEWAPNLVAVEPLSDEFRATVFLARSLAFCKHPENYSVWFDLDSGKPTMDLPGFTRTLELARQTWRHLTPDSWNMSPADCRRMILEGKAAITLSYEPNSGRMTELSGSDSAAIQRADGITIGVCRLPGSRTVYNRNSKKWDTIPNREVHAPALCGFAGLAGGVIAPSDANQDLAASNLLISLTSSGLFEQAITSLPKSPCRESQVTLAASWFGPDLTSEEAGQLCDVTAQSLRDTQLVFELPLRGADEFRQAISRSITLLRPDDSDVAHVQKVMQQSLEQIVERRGADAVRDSHRRGLGLSPAMKKDLDR